MMNSGASMSDGINEGMSDKPAPLLASWAAFLTRHTHLLLAAGTVVGALGVGLTRGLGTALLTLAGGALLAVIMLLWRSILLLLGEGSLVLEEHLPDPDSSVRSATKEQKAAVLRTLKDLAFERSVGKLTDEDYEQLSAPYRAQAKALLRALDTDLEPARKRAEAWVVERRARASIEPLAIPSSPANPAPEPISDPALSPQACSACATFNEPDAVFCKRCGQRLPSEVAEASS